MSEKKIKIPKSFQIGGITWIIKVDNEKLSKAREFGTSHLATATIEIVKIYKGDKLPELVVEQTLYHEVVHSILDTMGEYKLSANEKFVQQFSLLLHQFEKTKK